MELCQNDQIVLLKQVPGKRARAAGWGTSVEWVGAAWREVPQGPRTLKGDRGSSWLCVTTRLPVSPLPRSHGSGAGQDVPGLALTTTQSF